MPSASHGGSEIRTLVQRVVTHFAQVVATVKPSTIDPLTRGVMTAMIQHMMQHSTPLVEAQRILEQSVTLLRSTHDTHDALTGHGLQLQGLLATANRDHTKALAAFTDASQIFSTLYGNDSKITCDVVCDFQPVYLRV